MFKVQALCTNIVFCVVTDLSSLREEIRSLRQREQQLLKYKEQSEIEFGQRRAKFKELYLAREGKDIVIRLYLLQFWEVLSFLQIQKALLKNVRISLSLSLSLYLDTCPSANMRILFMNSRLLSHAIFIT